MTAQPKRSHDPKQVYDAHKLIDEVQALLWERGLNPGPQMANRAMAVSAAGQLLRSFGITPAMSMETALKERKDIDGLN